MAENSSIEWTDTTWNPILGCSRVSPGCDRCYAITQARIRAGNPHPRVSGAFEGLTDRIDGRIDWTGQVNLRPERLAQPLGWRKPRKVFVNSLADLFHEKVPDEFIARVFAVMAATPRHTYQILTKRHGRMRSLLNAPWFPELVTTWAWRDGVRPSTTLVELPAPNVWLGVSVENQKWADIRIPALVDTPAAVRFLSCEPLLGPVDLSRWMDLRGSPLGWVVAGGESGPGARPMHPDWPRLLRDQCAAGRIPYLFKQWGQWRPGGDVARPATWFGDDGQPVEPGLGTAMVSVGKKAAGRVLDGETHDGFPEAVHA